MPSFRFWGSRNMKIIAFFCEGSTAGRDFLEETSLRGNICQNYPFGNNPFVNPRMWQKQGEGTHGRTTWKLQNSFIEGAGGGHSSTGLPTLTTRTCQIIKAQCFPWRELQRLGQGWLWLLSVKKTSTYLIKCGRMDTSLEMQQVPRFAYQEFIF